MTIQKNNYYSIKLIIANQANSWYILCNLTKRKDEVRMPRTFTGGLGQFPSPHEPCVGITHDNREVLLPIRDMLDAAGLYANSVVTCQVNDGELIIRTAEKQAIAANDATVLELMRRMRVDDQTLVGLYLIANWPGCQTEGVITSIANARTISEPTFLSYGIHTRLYLNGLADRSVLIVLASTKEEAEKILATRQAD